MFGVEEEKFLGFLLTSRRPSKTLRGIKACCPSNIFVSIFIQVSRADKTHTQNNEEGGQV